MATRACKVLCLIILLAFITQGYGSDVCGIAYLKVNQSKTGRVIQGKLEWEVRVTNTCEHDCYIETVTMRCLDFQSVTPVPTDLVLKEGPDCYLNDGQGIYPDVDFVFNYVWDTDFDLPIIFGFEFCD